MVDTIVIDPFDRLDIPTNEKEYLYIRTMLSELTAFAKKMNVLVIFVAHPKKPDGEEAPNMYSISGSTAWYNACDYGVIIHRDRDEDKQLENTTQVIIAKIKDVDLGNPSGGMEKLRFSNNRLKECCDDY